jgi:hypothetical protein
MKKIGFVLIIMLLFPSMLMAKREHPEKWYQKQWCEKRNGQIEVVLADGTRCDCLTNTHAIEFDFGNNWAELILLASDQKETRCCSAIGITER